MQCLSRNCRYNAIVGENGKWRRMFLALSPSMVSSYCRPVNTSCRTRCLAVHRQNGEDISCSFTLFSGSSLSFNVLSSDLSAINGAVRKSFFCPIHGLRSSADYGAQYDVAIRHLAVFVFVNERLPSGSKADCRARRRRNTS